MVSVTMIVKLESARNQILLIRVNMMKDKSKEQEQE